MSQRRGSNHQAALEKKLECKLNQTGVIHRGVDRPEAGSAQLWTRKADGAARSAELWMVKDVEEFRPELQLHGLADREVLYH